jgi:hypothetical protein
MSKLTEFGLLTPHRFVDAARAITYSSAKTSAFLTVLWVRLVPVGKDLLGLFYLFFQAREVKSHFPGSARDVNLERVS